jgi:hypothetical protein
MKTDGGGSETTLDQTITVMEGAEITGSSFFFDGEVGAIPDFCDTAMVEIYVEGALGATPFNAGHCVASHTDWTAWSFTVPGDGCDEVEVQVLARITNSVDSDFDSLMGLDAVEVVEAEECLETPTPTRTPVPTATPTPEPEMAQITISKETVGFLSQEFDFETDFGESFSLAHGDSITFEVEEGTYEVTEKPETAFTLHSVVCDGDGDDDPIPNGVEIEVDEGDVIECTFFNARPNVSGAIQFQPPPVTATPQQVTAPVTAPVISPPNTGTAGLR